MRKKKSSWFNKNELLSVIKDELNNINDFLAQEDPIVPKHLILIEQYINALERALNGKLFEAQRHLLDLISQTLLQKLESNDGVDANNSIDDLFIPK